MQVDRKLNLVVPIERNNGTTIYVHSMPISREVFERYHLEIAKTFSAIYQEGLGFVAGPRVAAMLLRRVSEDLKSWDDNPEAKIVGVANGLMAEVRRLSCVLVPGANGWEMVPLQEALDRKAIDEDDAAEVENALVYFTVASSMHKRTELKGVLAGASKLWGGHVTSLNCSEYSASLPTSTAAGNTGEKAKPSSPPS